MLFKWKNAFVLWIRIQCFYEHFIQQNERKRKRLSLDPYNYHSFVERGEDLKAKIITIIGSIFALKLGSYLMS